MNSFYGPSTQQIDLGLARSFKVTEHSAITLQAQVFNLLNHANFYVQNGTGVVANQYTVEPFANPDGSPSNCGDGVHTTQSCYLVPNSNFRELQIINYLNGPRVMQFALKFSF